MSAINVFTAIISNYYFIVPALSIIESEYSSDTNQTEPLQYLEEFINSLPEEIDGNLEDCIDQAAEQEWYTGLKHPTRTVHFLCKNLYEVGDTLNGWNIDFCQYLYYSGYEEKIPSYLQFKTKFMKRQKHYLEKAEKFLKNKKALKKEYNSHNK